MTLTDLMTRSDELGAKIRLADEAFNHAEFDRFWDERASVHAFASHLGPTNDAEAHFLGDRIVEYAEFLSDVPTHEVARLEALAAIKRMSDALAEWAAAQDGQREAA